MTDKINTLQYEKKKCQHRYFDRYNVFIKIKMKHFYVFLLFIFVQQINAEGGK